jgi:hypothetical protein
MKKLCILLLYSIPLFCASTNSENSFSTFDLAATTGYVWKTDSHFKQVYGNGIQNVITIDGCYWPFRHFGVGIQNGYWLAHGKTTVSKRSTRVWEVPLNFYLQGRIGHLLQLHGSLGTGVIFVNEKSYLGTVSQQAWSGEAEAGIDYYFFKRAYLAFAVQYLYARKEIKETHNQADFGGVNVSGGIGISF